MPPLPRMCRHVGRLLPQQPAVILPTQPIAIVPEAYVDIKDMSELRYPSAGLREYWVVPVETFDIGDGYVLHTTAAAVGTLFCALSIKAVSINKSNWIRNSVSVQVLSTTISYRIPAREPPQLSVIHSMPYLVSDTLLSLPRPRAWVSRVISHRRPSPVVLPLFSRARARGESHVKDLRLIVPERRGGREAKSPPALAPAESDGYRHHFGVRWLGIAFLSPAARFGGTKESDDKSPHSKEGNGAWHRFGGVGRPRPGGGFESRGERTGGACGTHAVGHGGHGAMTLSRWNHSRSAPTPGRPRFRSAPGVVLPLHNDNMLSPKWPKSRVRMPDALCQHAADTAAISQARSHAGGDMLTPPPFPLKFSIERACSLAVPRTAAQGSFSCCMLPSPW